MSEYRSLHVLRPEPGIAEVRLLGPGRGNAMGPDFWRELPDAVSALSADADLRAVVVFGEGGHFSFGLDLPAMAGVIAPHLERGAAGRTGIIRQAAAMQRGFDLIANAPQPWIAGVDGWCIGAGIEMIAACDLRLCSAAARFALREVRVGIVPDLGGIQRLPHLVGEAHARALALTGDEIDATEAARIGLVGRVCDSAEALRSETFALARRIAANPPLVVAGIKRCMGARIEAGVAAGNRDAATLNGLLMQSEDFAEAIRAFMEKRAPSYRGR
jgi:enoyl-CoA hydratase